jgi:hypothetical protein
LPASRETWLGRPHGNGTPSPGGRERVAFAGQLRLPNLRTHALPIALAADMPLAVAKR